MISLLILIKNISRILPGVHKIMTSTVSFIYWSYAYVVGLWGRIFTFDPTQ